MSTRLGRVNSSRQQSKDLRHASAGCHRATEPEGHRVRMKPRVSTDQRKPPSFFFLFCFGHLTHTLARRCCSPPVSDIFSHALKPAGKFTPRSPRSHCSPLASSETNIALHMAEQSTSGSSRHVARTLRNAWRLSLLRFEAHSDVCSRLEVPSLCVCARMPGLLMACSLESLASGPTRDADRVGRLPPSRPGMQLQRGAFGKTLKFSQPKRQPRRIERWGNFKVVRPKL